MKVTSNLSKFIFLLSLLSTTSVAFRAEAADQASVERAFLQCFIQQSHDPNAALLILSPTTNFSSFNTTYFSFSRSIRILRPGAGVIKPFFIVLPTGISHVQAVVSCGRRYGLRLRVRSGGHDYEGLSYASYGTPFVLLDISNFRSVDLDRTGGGYVWVGAGATIGDLAYYISIKNKTAGFPSGTCHTIGVGEHFSAGGIGPLIRKYGSSADNIIDVKMVNANGHLVNRTSMGEDAFWAICGGSAASFRVVLSYKIKLVYIPSKVTTFVLVRTLETGATQLLEKWQTVITVSTAYFSNTRYHLGHKLQTTN